MQGSDVVSTVERRQDALRALLDEPIDWRFKGFPPVDGVTIGTVGRMGRNVLRGELPLPTRLC